MNRYEKAVKIRNSARLSFFITAVVISSCVLSGCGSNAVKPQASVTPRPSYSQQSSSTYTNPDPMKGEREYCQSVSYLVDGKYCKLEIPKDIEWFGQLYEANVINSGKTYYKRISYRYFNDGKEHYYGTVGSGTSIYLLAQYSDSFLVEDNTANVFWIKKEYTVW